MPLYADRRAIKQIAINLLSNAVKFTGEGGHISVRARNVAGALMLTIEDNGCGIPKDALGKLGRPFEQVQNQFSKSHTGSGLGLAISRSLAQLHGGALKIRSTEGVGTIVSVRIPIKTADRAGQGRLTVRSRGVSRIFVRGAQQAVEMAAGPLRRFLQMRFQHLDVRQVGCGEKQVDQAGRAVLLLERPGQAEPDHLRQRQIERIGVGEVVLGLAVGEAGRKPRQGFGGAR